MSDDLLRQQRAEQAVLAYVAIHAECRRLGLLVDLMATEKTTMAIATIYAGLLVAEAKP
ncbi:MAG: hypothetical protein ACLPTF_19620 [Steroidobacteraceae bacterium]